jgi:hypothetical protein
MEIRCLRLGEPARSGAGVIPKASMGGCEVNSVGEKKTDGADEEACIIATECVYNVCQNVSGW